MHSLSGLVDLEEGVVASSLASGKQLTSGLALHLELLGLKGGNLFVVDVVERSEPSVAGIESGMFVKGQKRQTYSRLPKKLHIASAFPA